MAPDGEAGVGAVGVARRRLELSSGIATALICASEFANTHLADRHQIFVALPGYRNPQHLSLPLTVAGIERIGGLGNPAERLLASGEPHPFHGLRLESSMRLAVIALFMALVLGLIGAAVYQQYLLVPEPTSTAAESASTATTGCMKNPAATPSPAGPSP